MMGRRYKMRRWSGGVAAAVLCLALLAGCGQSVPSDPTEDPGIQADTADDPSGGTAQTDGQSGGTGAADSPSSDAAQEGTSQESEAASGTAPEEQEAAGTPVDALPADLPDVMTFCSGAGAWRTNLSLASDGSFTGQFTDWDAGSDPTYPGGFYLICTFSGSFGDLRQLDAHSYSMVLEDLTCQETEGEEWVEDGTLYTGSTPYGLEGGTTFYLYAPESSTDVLTTESLQVQWPQWNLPGTVPETQLGCWLLYNADMDQGFFSYT